MTWWQILLIVLSLPVTYYIYVFVTGKKGVARITIDANYSMSTELISPSNNVLSKRNNGSYSESAIRHLSNMYENQGYRVVIDSSIQRDEMEKEFAEEEIDEIHNKEKAINKFKGAGLTFEEADYLAQDIAELSLYADSKLFTGEEDNVHSIEEAYKDKYYMSTVDQLLRENLPIKAIAYTGIQARAMGLNFEVRTAMKKSVFDYLEREELDNTHFKEAFMQTLNTVQVGESTNDVSPVLSLLYTKGWIFTEDTDQYDESIGKMTEQVGTEQSLKNFQTLFQEGAEWYTQVNSPESQLQKITSFSLSWLGGKLEDIISDLSNENLASLDILLNASTYQEKIFDALSEAEDTGSYPKMDDSYRNEVAGRILQYMQEKKRLIVLTTREVQIEVVAIQHIIDRLNKSKLDYDDIENVYHNSQIGDTVLTLEMNNEENFSLVFDNIEDMQMAQDIISFATYADLSDEKEAYFYKIGIPELLEDSTKMLFDDFIDQYDLDNEELDAVYKWEENNDEENRENKIVDFSHYNLKIIRGALSLVAVVLRKTEDEVTDSNTDSNNEKPNAQPEESDDTLEAISEIESHINLLSIEEKTIDMMSKVSRDFSDETNLENLIEMGYGKEEDLRTWFTLDMPGGKETGGSYIIGRFLQMLRIHNMIHQEIREHVIIAEAGEIIENEHISARIDELAEINCAHGLATSFEDWQGQFLMELKEHNIEYAEINESYITSYLVLETMFRAMILRMN